MQHPDAAINETLPPPADGGFGQLQARGNLGIAAAFGGPQRKPRPPHQRMRKAARRGKSVQFLLLLRDQFQRDFRTSQRHTQAHCKPITCTGYS